MPRTSLTRRGNPCSCWILSLKVVSANRAFHETFQVSPEETENRLIYDLKNRQWDIPRLRELLEKILRHDADFENFEVEHEFPEVGPKGHVPERQKDL